MFKLVLNNKWAKILANNPDFIKIIIMYSEEFEKRKGDKKFTGKKGIDPKLVPLVVDMAHKASLRVSAHIETAYDFHVAVEAGVDEINHLPAYMNIDNSLNYIISEEDAKKTYEKGIIVVPTYSLLNSNFNKLVDSLTKEKIKAMQIDNLTLLKKNKVKIAIGCDDYMETSAKEFNYLKHLNLFTNKELLNMYMQIILSTIFPNRKIGKIERGYEASFLILNENPLEDLKAINTIESSYKEGERLEIKDY